jgi:hypothetical protein
VAEQLQRLGLCLGFREPINPDSAEVVGDGDHALGPI